MKRKHSKIFKGLMVVVLSVGLILLVHPLLVQFFTSKNSSKYIGQVLAETMPKNEENQASFDTSTVGEWSPLDLFKTSKLPVVGAIAIPELDLSLPILNGLGSANLAVGAGTMKEGQQMGKGNYSLAGHSLFGWYGYNHLLFTPLKEAKVGQDVYLHDGKNIYTYHINKVFIVEPDESWVISDNLGDGMLTLVTCTDANATKRIIIQASLVAQRPIEGAPSDMLKVFKV